MVYYMSENEGDKIKVDTISTKDEEVTLSLEVETAKNQTQTPPIENPLAPKPVHRTSSYGNQGGGNNRNSSNNPNRFNKRNQEYEEKLVNVARVTTVVKGGRRFSFSVIVVIGNRKGKVGYGHGKANEVPDAIKKAIKDAQRNLINVPIVKGGTIPHVSEAKFVASKVLLKPAQKGRGLIASGSVRAVIELAGYKDIVTKSIGSSNKTNVVKATLKALQQLSLPEDIARLRDVSMSSFAGQK